MLPTELCWQHPGQLRGRRYRRLSEFGLPGQPLGIHSGSQREAISVADQFTGLRGDCDTNSTRQEGFRRTDMERELCKPSLKLHPGHVPEDGLLPHQVSILWTNVDSRDDAALIQIQC